MAEQGRSPWVIKGFEGKDPASWIDSHENCMDIPSPRVDLKTLEQQSGADLCPASDVLQLSFQPCWYLGRAATRNSQPRFLFIIPQS